METENKAFLVAILMVVLVFGGTLGYMVIEGLSLLDSLYMTIITISTVGFREVQDLSTTGQLFTIILIFCGLFVAAFAVTVVSSFVIEGEFKYIMRRRRMENSLNKLKDHYIVCGAGDTGYYIINQFMKDRVSFVVIDSDPAKVDQVIEHGGLAIEGDATIEEDLLKVGIKRAKGLLCCLSTDADNVFTVLTAREIKPELYIISRAIDDKADLKLMKAGADKTVSPNEIGGVRMASLVMRPAVCSFLDVITRAGQMTVDLEEIDITNKSELNGITLAEARIPERTGLIVIAVKNKDDETIFNPGSDYTISESDTLIVMGKEEKIEKLYTLAGKTN
ncbi:MAG: potassium channel protein [Bacillota bacterium]